jgi:GDP-mannose 6-dehydrogenase
MVKYTDNAWHALKVAFANEIGAISKAVDVDSHEVMNIFCRDTKLNLSPYYLKPGYAFGGSCLPKDLRALNYKAKAMDVDVPLLNSILPSNAMHTERGIRMVLEAERRRVGVLGFSFKAGTDDLRESPLVSLIETLIGKGLELKLYDRNVNLAALVGANRDFILNRIPHISRLMVDSMEEVISFAEVIVIGNPSEEFRNVPALAKPEQMIIDLVRVADDRIDDGRYEGICW